MWILRVVSAKSLTGSQFVKEIRKGFSDLTWNSILIDIRDCWFTLGATDGIIKHYRVMTT